MFSSDDDDDDHDIRRADTGQALARWQRLGASHEGGVTRVVLTWRHGRRICRRLHYILFFLR